MDYDKLISELRKVVKTKRITYRMIARHLGVSENTIKRTFHSTDGTFSRINKICQYLGVDLSDLIQNSQKDRAVFVKLPSEAEAFFSQHLDYFHFFILLYDQGLSVPELQKRYELSLRSVRKYLKKLEDLKLLEIQLQDQVKFKLSGIIELDKKKDLYSLVVNNHLIQYLKDVSDPKKRDDKTQDIHIGVMKMLPETLSTILHDIRSLDKKCSEASKRETSICPDDQLVPTTYVFSIGRYQPKIDHLPEI